MVASGQRAASELVGATPRSEVRTVSLAVRRYLLEALGNNRQRVGIVIAVSGGADSLAMAVAALDLAQRWGLPAITVTVDHGIRPESASEAETVAELMRSLGACQAVVASAANSQYDSNSGPEGNARDLRYRCLLEESRKFYTQKRMSQIELLLGQTMDDQAETVLLRLARGSGTNSLGGIQGRRPLVGLGWLGRPLIGIRRAETEAFCKSLDLPVIHDPSNRTDGPWRTAGGDPLRRSAVREWVLPTMKEALGQDVTPALARTATQLQQDQEALQIWTDKTVALAELKSPYAKGERYEISELARVPSAIRVRALRQIVLEAGVPAGSLMAVHLGFLDALLTDWHGQGAVMLPAGVRVRRERSQIVIEKPAPGAPIPVSRQV